MYTLCFMTASGSGTPLDSHRYAGEEGAQPAPYSGKPSNYHIMLDDVVLTYIVSIILLYSNHVKLKYMIVLLCI